MDKEFTLGDLDERDHQKTLAVINWLNNCRNRDELNQVLKEALLPLMACNGVFYARHTEQQDCLQLLDGINLSTCCQYGWKQLMRHAMQKLPATQTATNDTDTVLTTNTVGKDQCNGALVKLYESFDQSWQHAHRYCAILSLQDEHRQAYRFYFCRLNATQQAYSQRDIALLKTLKPSLLQTMKLVIFREESRNFGHIMAFWSEHAEPVAVIRSNGEILFQNPAFELIGVREEKTFMSTALAFVNTAQRKKLEWQSFLSKLGKRLYEIKLTLINGGAKHQQCTYLLHLSRVTHATGKIFNQLSNKGLTRRELEIALLIYQGTQTREISEQIHLSYHTVRNHIKSIYSKLGVSSRGEMFMWIG